MMRVEVLKVTSYLVEPDEREATNKIDGGNAISVDDDRVSYWQTKVGYDAAIKIYTEQNLHGLKSHLLYTILKPRSMIL